MIFNLIGSLGLFLLGMWLMTEGLKLAGGRALESLLGKWTSSRIKGLASGMLITSLVQASGAVTVATIGFVNAGLMKFQQSVWVVFGSNVGTTFTAWIVTFFGFSMNIDALTSPLVGVGAMLRIFYPSERGKALGMALAGFGLFFMGIDALKDSFFDYAHQINIGAILSESGHETLWALGIGLILTVLTQSSSAAITIILTAVASGVAGVHVAAAAVIGANIGTTSTALIATIGATPNAKRLAWAHVVFNVLTAAAALLVLPTFWVVVSNVSNMTQLEGNPVMMLAIFHTFFNIMGVLLMWPLEPKLSAWLLTLYEKKPVSSSHLDSNVVGVPGLAVRSMTLELKALLESMATMALPVPNKPGTSALELSTITDRINDINEFIAKALKSGLTKEYGDLLTLGLWVTHHLHNACMTFNEAKEKYGLISSPPAVSPKPLSKWFNIVNDFNFKALHSDVALQNQQLSELMASYKLIKRQLLEASVDEKLNIGTVDTALHAASLSRRFVEQILQADEAYQSLKQNVFSESKMPDGTDDEDAALPVKPKELLQVHTAKVHP